MNISKSNLAISSAVALVLAACSTQPVRVDDLETARASVQRVEASPDAGKYAAAEIEAAHKAIREADELAEKRKSREDVQQAAYVAQRHADIAVEQIQRGQAQEQTAAAEAERQKVLLQAREQEAAAARARAEATARQAQAATQHAQAATQDAEAARRDAEAARADAEAQKQQARMRAEAAQLEAAELAAQLRDLQAKQTERGLVLTLGDVLFDTGQATLKPGADSTIDRLSAFLSKSPERSVIIEGHTDSVGTDLYNQALSESRASSVKAALVAKGVAADRIMAVGKGEAVPVAGNDSAGGRQQNRRVEIIIANPPEVARGN